MGLGIRLHVVCRDSAEEAWREAERLLDGIPAQTIEDIQARLRRSESEGQRRMMSLHNGSRPSSRSHPTCGGAGAGLAAPGVGARARIAAAPLRSHP